MYWGIKYVYGKIIEMKLQTKPSEPSIINDDDDNNNNWKLTHINYTISDIESLTRFQ